METTHHADALLVKIREAKEAQDLTNEDLAEMTGINETTISRIISGAGKRPSFDTLVTMAAALHISVDKIPEFQLRLQEFMDNRHGDILDTIRSTGKLEKDTEDKLKAALTELLGEFTAAV